MLEAWLWDQREEGREASTNKVKYGLEDMAKAIKEGKKKGQEIQRLKFNGEAPR